MLALAIAGLTVAHTPQTFLKDKPTGPLHMHDVNTSQVHYIKLHPGYPVTFIQSAADCWYEEVSLGRFESTEPSVTVHIDGQPYLERDAMDAGIEPFTTTPGFKTLNMTEVHGCNITLSTTRTSIIYFVSGKAEDWWLFSLVPYYAYKIQWGWAFTELGAVACLWPLYIYLALSLLVAFHSEAWLLAIAMYAVLIDIIVPTSIASSMAEEFPTDRFWLAIAATRLVIVLAVLYRWRARRSGALAWIVLFLMSTAVAFGGYVLIPLLVYSAV